ncbi:short-chain dehydrogenase/reductase family protein [Dictyostelium discoideum AX4]|uniref:Short-chain dehydrogenase/reductase family protein n=1 Tax=Dictyostelium discoideum TaxID=44689 RepID=Q55E92_DICDI|nr:short-chain dehydrogenase/reductase family protein [Dictyostelium discoideum AX4]EAL72020.1 short-chain dehydrogenase/reductase family protein [Dictyostelium discoideum AX4]|eukprot:XP_645889.1 short-chain dehydrogenase/reductase family protein [Dictyostelium discoideum AX4]
MEKEQVWYITGCTSGCGLALVEKLLKIKGTKVAGTTRDLKKIEQLSIYKDQNFLALQVDLVNSKSVEESIEKTIKHFGSITHVVNNAGFALMGTVEEASDKEQREQMDVCYFAPLNVIRSVLPHFRSKSHGYIFNIGSGAGFRGIANLGAYSGSKFAITGITEALHEEVKQFSINVSTIVLGYIETDFHEAIPVAKNLIDCYSTQAFSEQRKENLKKIIGGDPQKVADVLIDYSYKSNLPFNIFVGPTNHFNNIETRAKELLNQIQLQREKNNVQKS